MTQPRSGEAGGASRSRTAIPFGPGRQQAPRGRCMPRRSSTVVDANVAASGDPAPAARRAPTSWSLPTFPSSTPRPRFDVDSDRDPEQRRSARHAVPPAIPSVQSRPEPEHPIGDCEQRAVDGGWPELIIRSHPAGKKISQPGGGHRIDPGMTNPRPKCPTHFPTHFPPYFPPTWPPRLPLPYGGGCCCSRRGEVQPTEMDIILGSWWTTDGVRSSPQG